MGKNNISRKLEKKNRYSILYTLVCRALLFVSLLSVSVFFIYIAGNYQRFLDSTQRYLLRCCSISCVLGGILGVVAALMSVVMFFVTSRGRYWGCFFLDIVVTVLAVAEFVLAYAMSFVSSGM